MSKGRVECPKCEYRGTEFIRSHSNKKTVRCDSCGYEWKIYTGEECVRCESRNTIEQVKGVEPDIFKVRKCKECGYLEEL